MASGIYTVLLVGVVAVALTDAYGNQHSSGSVPQIKVYGQSISHGHGHSGTVARPAQVYNKKPQGHVHGSVPQRVYGHSIRQSYGQGGKLTNPALGYNIKPYGHVHGGHGSVPQSKVYGQSIRQGGTVAQTAKGYNKRPLGHVHGEQVFGRNREYDKVVIHSNNGHVGSHNEVVVNGHRPHGYATSHSKGVVRVHPSDGYQTGHNKVIVDVHGGHREGHGYKEFTIVDGRFSYKGDAYRLQCDKKRFVSLWKRCYGLYHSRSICFGRLRKQKLFVAYTSGNKHKYRRIFHRIVLIFKEIIIFVERWVIQLDKKPHSKIMV